MEPTQWTLSETFQFPAEYGKAVSAQEVNVTAGYTEQETEDAVRLSGVYLVKANVTFDGEGQEKDSLSEAVLIDDVDVEEQTGYFEYAVPLLVDFPSSGGNFEAKVIDATASATDDGGLVVMWTVEAFQKEIQQPAATAAVEEATVESQDTAVAYQEIPTAEQSETAEAAEQVAHYTDDDSSSSARFTAIDSVSDNEMVGFFSNLEDDVTVTTFRLNDVFVE
ncbi:hypothetical protein [Sporosarcina aquimarina]|uniref:Uncharacterized protein n=1 Tax=Sporosarcina aquimarina TaxID=114975 RepID=A0ABU4FZX2_9BACL|nr:hypothetical protein [Sporosarcina aquimarina]MDW0109660.1 hypothetical protein [Sporosarcina aquimarina]